MTNKLEMPLEQFAEAVAKENERLISGPGGIMEMKQTIADKEKRIDQLKMVLQLYADELALMHQKLIYLRTITLKALDGKKLFECSENYGQGSEPWLKDVK